MIDAYKVRTDAVLGKSADVDVIFALCDEVDRLRGEQQAPPQGKTVEVRVAVSVTPDGEWVACGGSDMPYDDMMSYCEHDPSEGDVLYWLTATLPVPAEVTVVARVEGE